MASMGIDHRNMPECERVRQNRPCVVGSVHQLIEAMERLGSQGHQRDCTFGVVHVDPGLDGRDAEILRLCLGRGFCWFSPLVITFCRLVSG